MQELIKALRRRAKMDKDDLCLAATIEIESITAEVERLKDTNKALESDNYNHNMNLEHITAELSDLRVQWNMYGGDEGITAAFAELERLKSVNAALDKALLRYETDIFCQTIQAAWVTPEPQKG